MRNGVTCHDVATSKEACSRELTILSEASESSCKSHAGQDDGPEPLGFRRAATNLIIEDIKKCTPKLLGAVGYNTLEDHGHYRPGDDPVTTSGIYLTLDM